MRYTEIDLQINDIMWFGIDMDGFIFTCTTAGTANVPEFVRMSKEQTELLADFFMEKLETTTEEILETPYIDNALINDAIILSKKGLFVFDAVPDDLAHEGDYIRISSPQTPIQFTKLPDEIQNLLRGHIVSVDVAKEKYIRIEHAYG